jgi:hypothetical protein
MGCTEVQECPGCGVVVVLDLVVPGDEVLWWWLPAVVGHGILVEGACSGH